MMARIRKAMDENQKGFTLVELLVVVIIIGILAAIAIPVYLGQSAKAQESAAKSDLSNAKTAFVVQLVDDAAFAKTAISSPADFTTKVPGFSKSADTETLEIKSYTPANTTATPNVPAAFCLTAKSVNGTTFYVTAAGTVSKTVC